MQQSYSVSGVKSFIGREGHGFNATLLCGTRAVAFVIDDASGGCMRFQWLAKDRAAARADEQALAEFCAAQPPVALDERTTVPCDPDLLLSKLVDEVDYRKRVLRSIRGSFLVIVGGQLKGFAKRVGRAAVDAHVDAKYPGAVKLYAMPEAAAVDAYIASAAA